MNHERVAAMLKFIYLKNCRYAYAVLLCLSAVACLLTFGTFVAPATASPLLLLCIVAMAGYLWLSVWFESLVHQFVLQVQQMRLQPVDEHLS
jgi:hypothetical protein